MQKRRRLVLILLGIGVMVGVLALVLPAPEPEYDGKRLSEWVEELATSGDNSEADVAIRQIGTNAVPHLLRWIRFEPASAAGKSHDFMNSFLKPVLKVVHISWTWTVKEPEWARASGAISALTKVDPRGETSLGELGRILNDPKASYGAIRAIDCLARIGTPALPTLLAKLTNDVTGIRVVIVSRLAVMEVDKPDVAPVLLRLLKDADPSVRRAATNALQ